MSEYVQYSCTSELGGLIMANKLLKCKHCVYFYTTVKILHDNKQRYINHVLFYILCTIL